MLKVVQDHLDLLFGLYVDFPIMLGAGFGVPANDVMDGPGWFMRMTCRWPLSVGTNC